MLARPRLLDYSGYDRLAICTHHHVPLDMAVKDPRAGIIRNISVFKKGKLLSCQ